MGDFAFHFDNMYKRAIHFKAGRNVNLMPERTKPSTRREGKTDLPTGAETLRLLSESNTAREQAEVALRSVLEQVQQRNVLLDTARQIALDILAQRTGVEALQHIAEAARQLARARYAALGVANPGGEGLQEFLVAGLPEEQIAIIGELPRGHGILGLLLKQEGPLRIPTLGAHPASVGFPPNHPPMNSFLGVPIRRGNTVLGSLYLTDKLEADEFSEDDAATVQELSAHAAVAIHYLQMQVRQRALLASLINAQEEERRAVAYDLHDGLTQYVMASHAHLEAFRRARDSGKEERAERELEQGLRYLHEAVLESRRLVNGLRTLALDDLGIAGALEQLLAEEKARAGWSEAEFIHNVSGQRYDRMLETTLYRVAQEALTNIRKHAETKRVRLLLLVETEPQTARNEIALEVRDWGHGFDPTNTVTEGTKGVGLHGMTERIRLLGGRHSIQSETGKGTTIRAVFPVIEAQEEDRE